MERKRRLALASLAILLLMAACASGDGKAQRGLPEAKLTVHGTPITVEIARSEKQREIGLMYRKSLAEGRGMIFVFEEDQKLSFWMKNTYIPLSIAFLSSSGRIEEIHEMKSLSEDPVRTDHYVRYAIEAPARWFEKIGAQPGDMVDLPGIR
jgi:uncharacterized protein